MAIVNLQAYKVDKIEFANALENGTKISLGNKYSYQVQYAVGKDIARGTFDIEVHDKENPDQFNIRIQSGREKGDHPHRDLQVSLPVCKGAHHHRHS